MCLRNHCIGVNGFVSAAIAFVVFLRFKTKKSARYFTALRNKRHLVNTDKNLFFLAVLVQRISELHVLVLIVRLSRGALGNIGRCHTVIRPIDNVINGRVDLHGESSFLIVDPLFVGHDGQLPGAGGSLLQSVAGVGGLCALCVGHIGGGNQVDDLVLRIPQLHGAILHQNGRQVRQVHVEGEAVAVPSLVDHDGLLDIVAKELITQVHAREDVPIEHVRLKFLGLDLFGNAGSGLRSGRLLIAAAVRVAGIADFSRGVTEIRFFLNFGNFHRRHGLGRLRRGGFFRRSFRLLGGGLLLDSLGCIGGNFCLNGFRFLGGF